MNTVEERPPRVLHVVEYYGGGLAAALREYLAVTPHLEHHLAFTPSLDAPVTAEDVVGFERATLLPSGPRTKVRPRREAVRRLVEEGGFDVVHAHSGWGSLYVRTAVRRRQVPIVYTPHCYAFLRRDHFPLLAAGVWVAERLLAFNTSVFAVCSPYEGRLSRWRAARAPVVYVPNAVARDSDRPTLERGRGPLRLLGVGRLLPQKDPEFFAEAVVALREAGVEHSAVWIGDGDTEVRARMAAAGVEVRGWIDHPSVLEEFAVPGTVHLLTAAWEGFPYVLLEADAAGAPSIVRRIRCLEDFDFPLAVGEPADVVPLMRALATPDGWERAVADTAKVLDQNSHESMRAGLLRAYDVARAGRSTRT